MRKREKERERERGERERERENGRRTQRAVTQTYGIPHTTEKWEHTAVAFLPRKGITTGHRCGVPLAGVERRARFEHTMHVRNLTRVPLPTITTAAREPDRFLSPRRVNVAIIITEDAMGRIGAIHCAPRWGNPVAISRVIASHPGAHPADWSDSNGRR